MRRVPNVWGNCGKDLATVRKTPAQARLRKPTAPPRVTAHRCYGYGDSGGAGGGGGGWPSKILLRYRTTVLHHVQVCFITHRLCESSCSKNLLGLVRLRCYKFYWTKGSSQFYVQCRMLSSALSHLHVRWQPFWNHSRNDIGNQEAMCGVRQSFALQGTRVIATKILRHHLRRIKPKYGNLKEKNTGQVPQRLRGIR